MQRGQKRILLAMGWYDYRVHVGIARFAEERGWHLCSDVTREKVIPWGWEGDGILAWLGAGDDLAEFVVRARKPTVDFSFRRRHLPLPRVLEDHAETARLAAEDFLSRGLTTLMYYSDSDNWSFEERGEGFVRAVATAGHPCTWLAWHRSKAFTTGREQWKSKRRWLAAQLKKAPLPAGVFTATDDHALEVLESCESAGLAVPEEVAIIGADNSLLALDAMRTPISSVDTNLETLGYRGAALLHDLMNGKPSPAAPIRVPPVRLIARKSSDLVAVNHKGVARSLRFLWDHCHERISVDDLVKVAGMSRSGLHQAFLEHIGRPPGAELHRTRIERAKRLLLESNAKTDVIAGMCGYQSANSFWVAFRQATGLSPKQFQKQVHRSL
jgi:LacI family transcriptional regulator, galactose operon repressor